MGLYTSDTKFSTGLSDWLTRIVLILVSGWILSFCVMANAATFEESTLLPPNSPLSAACLAHSGPICMLREAGCISGTTDAFCVACSVVLFNSKEAVAGCVATEGYKTVEDAYGRDHGTCVASKVGGCDCGGPKGCQPVDSYRYVEPKEEKTPAKSPAKTTPKPPTQTPGGQNGNKESSSATEDNQAIRDSVVSSGGTQAGSSNEAKVHEPEKVDPAVEQKAALQQLINETRARHAAEVEENSKKISSGDSSAEPVTELLERQKAEIDALQTEQKNAEIDPVSGGL